MCTTIVTPSKNLTLRIVSNGIGEFKEKICWYVSASYNISKLVKPCQAHYYAKLNNLKTMWRAESSKLNIQKKKQNRKSVVPILLVLYLTKLIT